MHHPVDCRFDEHATHADIAHPAKGTSVPTLRFRRGYSGRPCRRPVSSGPGVRSRGWARRSGPCAGPCRRARCGRLKNSQSARPAALATAFTRRAICDSDSPNTSTLPPIPAGRMASRARMAAGGDGHHRALGLGVGLRTDHRDAAGAVLPALHVAPGERRRFGTSQSRVGQRPPRGLGQTSHAFCSLLGRFHMPRPRLRGWTAVRRITARTSAVRAPDWRWGFAESSVPIPFKEARTPGSRQGVSSLAHSWAFADG